VTTAGQWWIISHRHDGWRAVQAATAKEARAWVRDGIAESFRDEGLSDSDARRGASSYGVCVIAGGCTEDEARDAVRAWDDRNGVPGQKLHDRWIAGTRRQRMNIDHRTQDRK
jgi:hypothetical protein